MRASVAQALFDAAGTNPNLFVVSGDAGFGVLDDFQRRFPHQYVNLGVAEQHAIGFAAGMALAGRKVVVYNIAPFVLYRCYEQVRNDICYQDLPVVLIGTGSGVAYAPAGMTHYSIEDVAVARTLPGLVVLSPADPLETRACMAHALRCGRPTYVRIAKGKEPVLHAQAPESVAEPLVLSEGGGVAVLCHGSVAAEVVQAVRGMERPPRVLSVPMLQPLGGEALRARLEGVGTILTVEEHYEIGGLGSIVADWMAAHNLRFRLRKLGFPHAFIHAVRNSAGLREAAGLSVDRIRAAVAACMAEGGGR